MALEDRQLLATINVTNAADDGSIDTLRSAIRMANAAATSTSIDIELGTSPTTITLSLGQLELSNTSDSITIYDGVGQGPVSISGNNESTVFVIDANVTATLSGLTITGGSTAANGGGLNNVGTLSLLECTISGNSAFTGAGLYNSGTATLTDCTITGNSSAGSGGGLFNWGTADLDSCTIADNIAAGTGGGTGGGFFGDGNTGSGDGGGVFDHGTANLINCTIAGNTAIYGGALFDYGQMTLSAATVSGNASSSNNSGGIFLYGYLLASGMATLTDTVIAGNAPSDFAASAFDSSFSINGTDNLTGFDSGPSLQSGVDGNIVLSNLSGLCLAPLGNYGGPTETMALLPGSAAISAGIALSGVTTDQRGDQLDSPAPDIGAYQTQGFTIAPVTGSTPQSAAMGDTFANPLAVTVTAIEPNQPVTGGTVTYTANPASNGASAKLSSTTATIGDDGTAQVNATANETSGGYTVTASIATGVTASFSLNNQDQPAFTGLTSPSIIYGTSSVTIAGTVADGPPVSADESVSITLDGITQDATIGSDGAFSSSFNTAALGVAGSPYKITYNYAGDADYASASATGTLTVTKATPAITWSNPAGIVYGTALSATQLDATASVPGVFTYTPAAGKVLHAGDDQALSVSFTPTDAADFNGETGSATIDVAKATPTITWSDPANIVYGTALFGTQLDASPSVPGTLTYTPAAGTVLNAGDDQTISVSFTPSDTIDYNDATGSAAINVDQATPAIAWADPDDIVFGAALSGTQLDATASVPGTFTYTPTAGTVLSAGDDQTLSVLFVPSDSADYDEATDTTAINVDQVTPTITWATPAPIVYGTALSVTQLDATASVPGTFTFTPPAGTVLGAGAGQELSVSFAPTDSVDFTGATDSVMITVTKARPTITWPNPAAITFGTALSVTQLDATASTAGTFTYTPAAGTVLDAGTHQALSVSFTPTDSNDFTTAVAAASITVNKATPTITWSDPADIAYGTALSGTQLDATASVPGTLTYTPAAGVVLGAGVDQTLSVSFAPTNSSDYKTATGAVAINVEQAVPAITWASPADIPYGTPLSETQLDATSPVAGSFTYTPAAGTVLTPGAGQTLSALFTPADGADFTTATGATTINVTKTELTITWAAPVEITYGTPLSGTQLDASANIPGTFTYLPAAGTMLTAGSGRTLAATFTPTDLTDYAPTPASTTIAVAKATPVLKLNDRGGEFDGAAFAASVTVAGVASDGSPSASLDGVAPTLTYYNGSGTTGPDLGAAAPTGSGVYTVVASFAGSADYAAVQSAPVTFTITAGTDAIGLSVSTSSSVFGEPVTLVARVTSSVAPGGTVTFFNGGDALGTVPLKSSGDAVLTTSDLAAGPHAVTATYSGDANLPGTTSGAASELVSRSDTTVVLVPVPVLKKKKIKSEILTAQIAPISPGGGVPTGTVIFELLTKKKKKTVTKTLGTAAVADGAGTLTLKPTKVLGKAITIVFSGDTNFEASTLAAPKLSKKGLL